MNAHHSNNQQFFLCLGTHFTPEYGADMEKAHSQGLHVTWLSLGFEPAVRRLTITPQTPQITSKTYLLKNLINRNKCVLKWYN